MTDVIIVGSGAGGLSAAVTAAHHGLKVTVVEKADVLGGATTWSGGWAWTPGSSFARRDGVHEDAEEFRTYLRAVLGERYRGDVAENIDAFLDAAPDMVDFFHDNTRLQFTPGSAIKDIYGDLPGAGTGHRSVGPAPFNARRIRPEVRAKLRHQLYETSFLGMGIMAGPDLRKFLSASRGDVSGWFHAARRVLVHAWDMVVHRRNMQMVNGAALVGRLAASADDLGVTMLTGTTAHELLTDGAGRVTGVRVQGPDGTAELAASCGVVLATGGFPADVELRSDLFPRTPTGREHHTLAPEEASGDGLRLALSVGAASCTDLAAPAAWCPVSQVPYLNGKVGTFPHIMDRAKPGSIGVVSTGRRFVNEADGYHDYVTAMLDAAPAGEPVCSWQVADSTFRTPVPDGYGQALPRAAAALRAQRLPGQGAHAAGSGGEVRHRPGRLGGHRRPVQRRRPARRGHGVPPRRHGVQPLRRGSGGGAEPVAGSGGEGTVLRGEGASGQLRHLRRRQCRRQGPGAG